MSSYQKMLSYHYSDSSCADKLSQFDKNYVQQKLQLGLARFLISTVVSCVVVVVAFLLSFLPYM